MCLAMSTQAGCLVVDEIQFEREANIPASISSAPTAVQEGTSLSEIVTIDLSVNTASPTGAMSEQEKRFPVIVRDANVGQNLLWQVFLNFEADLPQPAINGNQLPATGNGSLERPLLFTLPFSRLQGPGCYRLELLVSSAFKPIFPFRDPELIGDLATAVWWLYVTNSMQPTVDFKTCP